MLVSSLGVVLSGWIMSIELEADPSSLLLFFLFFFADLSSSDMVREARQRTSGDFDKDGGGD